MGNLLLAKSRIQVLAFGFLVVLLLMSLQLFRVQIFEAGNYKLRAIDEMETTRTVQAPRGDITDINGVAFARSVSAISIVVDQTQISDPGKTAAFVAPILGVTAGEIQGSLTGKRKYAMVLKNARPALWEKLYSAIQSYNATLGSKEVDKRIIGFFPERSYIREYPSGELISSLVGFVRADGVGAAGIESSMNSTITGTAGRYSYARASGAEIPGSQSEIIEPKSGTTVRLTINRDVQWVAAKAIADAVKSSGALNGTVIVMDPKTGEIIAHATAPTFDPNNTKGVSLD
jgi:cell division protein FtsI (penicillin-binding protein 3)